MVFFHHKTEVNKTRTFWALKTGWSNIIHIIQSMRFVVSHVYRESNSCADSLANHGLSTPGFSWWSLVPPFIKEAFYRNRTGLPSYRFH